MAPSSALPIGADRVVSEMQPVLVDAALPGSGLVNSVIAVLFPFNPDEHERYDEEILDLPILGFVFVYVLFYLPIAVVSVTDGIIGQTST
jgi:polyribonucleotide 5'-hydroxyl-kinase